MNIIHLKVIKYLMEVGSASVDVIKGHVPAITGSLLRQMERLAYILREQGTGYILRAKGLQIGKRYLHCNK